MRFNSSSRMLKCGYLLRGKSVSQYLGQYPFVRGTVLQAAIPAVHREGLPVLFIVQQELTLLSAFFRAAPENDFFILSVELGVLGSALGAQNAAQVRYFEGTCRDQVAISL